MANNVLVTGGAGFVGKHLVEALVKEGHKVTVVDALIKQVHHGKKPSFPKGVRFVKANVSNRKVMDRLLSKTDILYHQAAEVGVGQSMYEIHRYTNENVTATAILMELVVKHKATIKKVIVAGSVASNGEGAYICMAPKCGAGKQFPWPRTKIRKTMLGLGEKDFNYPCIKCGKRLYPIGMDEEAPLRTGSIYGLTKKAQEELVRITCDTNGIPWVSLRYFNIIGPGQSLSNPYTGVTMMFLNQLKEGKSPLIFEDGEQVRDFVSVHDIVQANILAMKRKKVTGVFNIGTGKPTKLITMANELASLLGRPDLTPTITGEFRKGDTRHLYSNIEKAQVELGYEPKVSLTNSLKEIIAWSENMSSGADIVKATNEMRKKGLIG